MQANPHLSMLFSNVSNLLKRDLSKQDMYRVEKRDFQELLLLLEGIINNVESLLSRNQISSDNLNAAYALPSMFKVYEEQKQQFSQMAGLGDDDEKIFFKFILNKLQEYYNTQKMDKNLKSLLSSFFYSLAREYEELDNFEKIEKLEDESSQLSIHELEYAG